MTARQAARRLRRRFPAWRITLVSVSLVGTMVLAAVGALVLRDSLAAHERAVERALADYMAYSARTFGEGMIRAGGELRLRAAAPGLGRTAASVDEGMSLDDFAAQSRPVLQEAGLTDDPLHGYFRIDPRTWRYEGRGAAARTELRTQVTHAVRERLPRLRREQEPALGYRTVGPDSTGLSIVWARQLTAGGETAAILGFTWSRDGGAGLFADRVMHEIPVLPPSFISPDWRYDEGAESSASALSVEVLDLAGRTLYRSPRQYRSPVRGGFIFRTNPGGFEVRTVLRPEVAAALADAQRQDARRRWMVALPLLSLLLGATAIVHLLREREIARARRTFVAAVSHELRTPLAQIRMFSETLLLRRDGGPEERARWLGVIGREARRMGDLVENVLALSHLEEPRIRLSRRPLDVGEVVEDVAATYGPHAAERGVRVEAHVPGPVIAQADADAMRHVLVNLVDNALKYGPPGQTVRLEALRSREGVLVAVSDQGPGIAPEDRRRLWKPYTRLESGGRVGGSGLGLAVVHRLVEQHGGAVRVEDAPGGGARFVVTLPAARTAPSDVSRTAAVGS